jgi:REP element-mobilizing transposase RayT
MHQVGDIHHVMAHGIDSLNLFETDEDSRVFMRILDKNLGRFECHCYGFVFMKNHYHLVLRPSDDSFSRMMRIINNTFARHVNKVRARKGYVFRDRFKSIPTRDLSYVKNLILYLHANPLRAAMVQTVEQLQECVWSSHQVLLGRSSSPSWLKTDFMKAVLSGLGAFDTAGYLRQISAYVNQEFNAWEYDPGRELPLPTIPSRIFADEARWVREKMRATDQKRIFQDRIRQQPKAIQTLLERSCAHFSVTQQHIEAGRRSRPVSKALKLFSYWAIVRAGFSGTLVGRLVSRSNTAVLRASLMGEKLSHECPFPLVAT